MAEPGENWLGERFGERPDKLRDGWELPRGWIDQVPNKGFIELVYFTSAKQVWIVIQCHSFLPFCMRSDHLSRQAQDKRKDN